MANMFDENGNYNKTEWKPGDRIAAGKLNKIEDALEAINNNDIERHKEADERLDALEEQKEAVEERFDELEDLVADNKSEVDTAIYEVHSKMDRLETKLDDGIDTVEAIAHTVDDKIADADASMKAQVNQGKADMEAMVAEVEGELESVNEQLEHTTTDLNNMTYYITPEMFGAVGDGVIDDTQAFKNMIEYVKSNSVSKITSKKCKYLISDSLVFEDINDLEIDFGKSEFIISDEFTLNDAIIQFKNSKVIEKSKQSVKVFNNSNLVQDIDTNGISVGDIAILFSSEYIDSDNIYKKGVYGKVEKIIDSNSMVISNPNLYEDLKITNVIVYKSTNNVNIKGVISNNENTNGIYIENAINCLVSDCIITGEGRCGIDIIGINSKVERCTIMGKRNIGGIEGKVRHGYGISLRGHNCIASNNILYDNKHCLASSGGHFLCTNIIYDNNLCWYVYHDNTQNIEDSMFDNLQVIDFHPTSRGVIQNNKIYGLDNPKAYGVMLREGDCKVLNNEFYASNDAKNDYCVFIRGENPFGNYKIIGNKFVGNFKVAIGTPYNNTDFISSNIEIRDNEIKHGYIRLHNVSNIIIEKNKISEGVILIKSIKENESDYIDIIQNKVCYSGPDENCVVRLEGACRVNVLSNEVRLLKDVGTPLKFYSNKSVFKDNIFYSNYTPWRFFEDCRSVKDDSCYIFNNLTYSNDNLIANDFNVKLLNDSNEQFSIKISDSGELTVSKSIE